MTFRSHGFSYETDENGVICQVHPLPFKYDAAYSGIYDTEAYCRGNETLQALRLGFVLAAYGKPVQSLLDMGYGNGAFMRFALQSIKWVGGYDITGVPVPLGCYVVEDFMKTPANVITFWDCLEHIHDISFLRWLPQQTLIVSLPYCHINTEGQEWFDTKYKHRKPNEHVRHFDERSLVRTMASYGWGAVANSGHEDIVRKSEHGLQNILTMAFKR